MASQLHHYLIKILRTRDIAKNLHIFTITSFIYFHFNNAARQNYSFYYLFTHRKDISRLYRSFPLVNSVFCFFSF